MAQISLKNHIGPATQYTNGQTLTGVSTTNMTSSPGGPVGIGGVAPVQAYTQDLSAMAYKQTADTIDRAGKLGMQLIGAYAKQKEEDENAEIIGSIADIQRKNAEYQSDYMKNNAGKAALTAGQDFASFSDNAFDELANSDKWKGNRRVQQALRAKKQEYGATAFGAGTRYATQQREVWHADQQKDAENGYFKALASGDPDGIRQARDNCMGLYINNNKGRDASIYEFELNKRGAQGALAQLQAQGDGVTLKSRLTQYAPFIGPEETAKWSAVGDQLVMAQGKGLPATQQQAFFRQALGGNGSVIQGANSATGQFQLLKKHESGTQGVHHISHGLPQTDGAADVGTYSFITKGGAKSSLADFIRYAGQSGTQAGTELFNRFQAVLGNDWNKIDSPAMWKTGGDLYKAWKETTAKYPTEIEQLEDSSRKKHFDSVIAKLRPEVRDAINSNPALYEMAASTINQHATAVAILNNNYDPDPETFAHNVYVDRSKPERFKNTPDPDMGRKRMEKEEADFRLMLHSGGHGLGTILTSQVARQEAENILTTRLPGLAILEQTKDMPTLEERKEAALKMVAELPEGQRQPAFEKVTQELNFELARRKASDDVLHLQFLQLAKQQGWSPAQQLEALDQGVASGKIPDRVADPLRTKITTQQNALKPAIAQAQKVAALDLMRTYDNKRAASFNMPVSIEEEANAALAANKITLEQYEHVMQYTQNGGKNANLTVPHVEKLYQDLMQDKHAKLDPELFSQVYRLLSPAVTTGKPIDDKAIKDVLSQRITEVSVPGYMWGTRDTPLWKASAAGSKVSGFVVPAYLLPQVKQAMRAAGMSEADVNDTNKQKQFYAGQAQRMGVN